MAHLSRRLSMSGRSASCERNAIFLTNKLFAVLIGMILVLLPVTLIVEHRKRVERQKVEDDYLLGRWNVPLHQPRPSPSPCNTQDNIAIFIAYTEDVKEKYALSIDSVHCYAKMHGYQLIFIDLFDDRLTEMKCAEYGNVYFRKHCSVAAHLEYYSSIEWILVLDADTGVINPEKCIEQYIDNSVNIVFYERFMNFEVAAGNYLVRNSKYSVDFLREWASYEFKRQPDGDLYMYADQGAIMMLLLDRLVDDRYGYLEKKTCTNLRDKAKDYAHQMKFVVCVRYALGASLHWDGQVSVLRKGQGYSLDWFLTYGMWTKKTSFLQHGWKDLPTWGGGQISFNSPFDASFQRFYENPKIQIPINPENLKDCSFATYNWTYVLPAQSENMMRLILSSKEDEQMSIFPKTAREMPWFDSKSIMLCWPNC